MTTTETQWVTTATATEASSAAAVAAAEQRVHVAERWLRVTRQSGIGEWVAGASALLHEAIEEYFRLGGTWSRPE
jgi:hypothetical protein